MTVSAVLGGQYTSWLYDFRALAFRPEHKLPVKLAGRTGGAGVYGLYVPEGHISTETLTETYGVLTVGSTSSGTVTVGQQVTGPGVLPLTAIEASQLSGSTWLVNFAQTVASENLTMTGAPLRSRTRLLRARPRIPATSRFSRTATSSTTHHP